MSPKISRPDRAPDDEPEEPGLPPGHMPMLPRTSKRPAPRKPLPLWLKSVGFVLLLAATVGVIWYLGRPDDPRGSARGTAELVATALSDGDTSAFRSYTCQTDEVTLPDDWAQLGTTTVLAVSDEYEGTAKATLTLSRPPDTDLVLLLHDEDDSWCVVAPGLCPLADDPLLTPGDLDPCANRPGCGG